MHLHTLAQVLYMQHYLPFVCVCVTATQLGSHPLTTTLSCDIPSRHLGRLCYLEHVLNAGQLQHEPSAMLEILGSGVSYKQPHLDEVGIELLRGFHLRETFWHTSWDPWSNLMCT